MMEQLTRRSALGVSTGTTCFFTGCLNGAERDPELFHLELVNEKSGQVPFNVLVEREDDTVIWESFVVEDPTEAEGSVGQLVPDLEIDTALDGPLHVRVQARGTHSELTLDSERIGWTADRTAADRHISVWLRSEGEIVLYSSH